MDGEREFADTSCAVVYTTDYLGLKLVKKEGKPNKVGSIRTLDVMYNNSTYQLTEPVRSLNTPVADYRRN